MLPFLLFFLKTPYFAGIAKEHISTFMLFYSEDIRRATACEPADLSGAWAQTRWTWGA